MMTHTIVSIKQLILTKPFRIASKNAGNVHIF